MKIEFYRSILCPRCLMVSRTLKKLKSSYPDLEVESIEITKHVERTWKEGIRSIPTLKINDDRLCGLLLTPAMVRRFIENHLNK